MSTDTLTTSIPAAGTPIIRLHQLTKKYGDFTAVNALSLDIYPGEVFGLLGPNGAGKTTTILMMLGLAEPTSGEASICGLDPARSALQVKRKVGYLPDDVGFYEDRTAEDNLVYTARLNRIPLREARRRAAELLQRVGLDGHGNQKVGSFSRGMRQRLGLADVLIKQPEVIILDEPTLGIDPEGVRELLQLISALSRDEGLTVLLSSHHLHQVQQICDRVGLFVQGQLIASGNVAELSRQLDGDKHVYVELTAQPWTEELARTIRELDGVTGLQYASAAAGEEPGAPAPVVTIVCDRDVSSHIAGAVIAAGASLSYIRKKDYGLEEIYHHYFERREGE